MSSALPSRSRWRAHLPGAAFAALALAVLAGPLAHAQTASLAGVVSDAASGSPLPAAAVYLPALDRGASTDRDGRYELGALPAGTYDVLVRFVGYREETVQATLTEGQRTALNVELREDLLQLEQVVVTGQGASVERRRMTAAVEVISLREIEAAPATTVDQLLQGRIPGATIRAVSAQPGQAAQINLRGISSFGSQTPVIYVDGVRVDNAEATGIGTGGEYTSALAELLVSDIERIEVTKGGAGSTLYGADAANGVIQIFTRRGVAGAPTVTVRSEMGPDFPELKYLKDTGFAYAGRVTNPEDSLLFGRDRFLRDQFFRTAFSQSHYVNVGGGRTGQTYSVSTRIQDASGVQPKNSHALYSLRGSVQTTVGAGVDVGFSGAYTRTRFERLFAGRALQDPLTAFEVGDALDLTNTRSFEDALAVFLSTDVQEHVDRFLFATSVTHRAGPRFDHRVAAGLDYRANEQRIFEPIDYPVVASRQGRLDRYNRAFTSVTLEYAGTLRLTPAPWVTSDLTFGAQGFRTDESTVTVFAENFALPGYGEFVGAGIVDATERRRQLFNGGVFVQEQVGLWDRLFLEAGLRLDGNSAFGRDVGLQAFPKVGAAYTLSQEPFWRERVGAWWHDLKLRVAYGETGNFPTPFARDRTFGAVSFLGESAPFIRNPGNPDLRPERTATLEGGIETALFRDRVGLAATAYRGVTTDALLPVPEQPATGLGTQLRNVGELKNVGLELEARARVFSTRRAALTVGGHYHTFENTVVSMGGRAPFGVGPSITTGGDGAQFVEEGRRFGEWYVTMPVDTDGDGFPDASERRYTGSVPYFTQMGAFRAELRLFERWTLSTLAEWGLGAEVLDLSARWSALNGIDRVVRPLRYPSAADIAAGVASGTLVVGDGDVFLAEDGVVLRDADGNPLTAGRVYPIGQTEVSLLQNGDYLKVREVTLRYAVPRLLAERVRMRTVTVAVTARNPLTFSRTDLLDPELNGIGGPDAVQLGGVSGNTLPPSRQFRLSLQVTL